MATEVIVLAVMVAIVLLVTITIYNGIITRMNSVVRAWTDVITQERQKNKIIPHLETVLSQYKEFEQSLQTKIAELRSALTQLSTDKIDSSSLAAAEIKTAELMRGVNIAVENYPDLKASELFNNFMREIAEQQENISSAIRIFNKNVEEFNNGIEIFPNSIINGLLNKKQKVLAFTDSEAEAGFEYKPNI